MHKKARNYARRALEALRARGLTLVTAESLTGGLIGATLTAIPGSSDFYWGGVVSYSVAAKKRLLCVPGDTIDQCGVVSAETASAMAYGALDASGADISVAVTGVAGPSGGSEESPVGTVFLACCLRGKTPLVQRLHFRGSRERVRDRTALAALTMVADCLDRN